MSMSVFLQVDQLMKKRKEKNKIKTNPKFLLIDSSQKVYYLKLQSTEYDLSYY